MAGYTVELTIKRIEDFHCPEGKNQAFLWDEKAPGLGVRVTPTGAKSFVFQGKLDGMTIRMTLGDVKTIPLDAPKRSEQLAQTARARANEIQRMLNEGKDPRIVKSDQIAASKKRRQETQQRVEAQRKRETLLAREAWNAYLQAPHPKWGATHRQDHINLSQPGGEPKKRGKGETKPGPLASLLGKPLASIDAKTLAAWLELEKQQRPTASLNAYRKFRAFINWCAESDDYRPFVQADCYQSKAIRDTMPEKRTKEGDCLQREQLPLWFDAVRQINNPVIAVYLQGLLLTGARREELAGLRWADVDFQWGSLTIKDKVEGERTIPLTPFLAHLLASLPRRNEWVFSSPTAEDGRIQEPRIAHNKALDSAGLPHVSLHGLRRSFGTLSEWVEMPAGVVAQIQGHKPSATAEKHYRRRPLDLLRKWHTQLEAWILEQAGIQFSSSEQQERLRVVK